ncbi:preprotein translocase subunit SecY [Pediococcus stilesii]|uniref:Preprotein translocase subunit SecY n=1 Tax=Pediococcus stilesii TaxID=331679 RepID=A0A5R9BW28_9LACO|nr:preprotein translocase subunit SecY [Pediococcus stilesii]TLQ04827.1 preprotein translocase subunit SecY [Pediococcus stilesii]
MIKKWFKSELVRKFMFTLMMMCVMELGKQIAIPALDSDTTRRVMSSTPFLRNLAITTGGQFNYPSIFSIGLAPYMTGMILFQVIMLLDIDGLNKLSKYQIGIVQRLISFFIAMLQSFQLIYLIKDHIKMSGIMFLGVDYNLIVPFFVLVAGAMLVSWMTDMMVKNGIGGAGTLIIPGIMSNMPYSLLRGQGLGTTSLEINLTNILICVFSILIVAVASVFMNKAELRIPLQRPMIQNDFSESYLPIKVLAAGSMPFMFSTALFLIPGYFGGFDAGSGIGRFLQQYWSFDSPVGIIIYCGIVVLLGYAFSFMNFRPENNAKQLKKGGDYIFGLTPGEETKKFLNKNLIYLSTIANMFFVIVIATPLVMGLYVEGISNLMFVFSNILILVTVMDTVIEQTKVLYLRTQYNLLEQ